MALIEIKSWSLEVLNPDGTVNTFLPSIAVGSVPPDLTTEVVDWLAMGLDVKIVLACTLSGDYPDTKSATLTRSVIRYNPALFGEIGALFYPPKTWPQGGYSVEVPGSFNPSDPTIFTMRLVGQGAELPSNINGDVTVELLNDDDFEITHTFRMVSDVETYISGRSIDNQTRFGKSNNYNPNEGDIDRPAVYGTLRGINCYVSIKGQSSGNFYNTFAPDLSIPVKAAYNNFDSDGDLSAWPGTWRIERTAAPGTTVDSLSPFEDNLVICSFPDLGYLIQDNEAELILTKRTRQGNVGTFEADLQLYVAKIPISGASTQLNGPIYSPSDYRHFADLTEIEVTIKGSLLEVGATYQLSLAAGIATDPSTSIMLHVLGDEMGTDAAPPEVDFTMISEFWSRNGNHAEEFTCAPNERLTHVLSMNVTEYDNSPPSPWTAFDYDIQIVSIIITDSNGNIVFSESMTKNSDNSWPSNDFIGTLEESGPSEDTIRYFYLKEFRIPYTNEQGLPDWIDETFTFKWKAAFRPYPNYGLIYEQETTVTVREYENSDPSPSGSDYISNIRFLDPETGYPISNWCETETILVVADVDSAGIGTDTYIVAMVDYFPLGVSLFDDFQLQEEDGETHILPDYVIFQEKLSDLISDLTPEPIDDSISFLLDISGLTNIQKLRIFVMAYRA